MKLAAVVSFAFLFSSMGASAQSFGKGSMGPLNAPNQTIVLESAPAAGPACPVSLRAQHLSDGSMVEVRDGHPNHPAGIGQWLHLTLANPGPRRMVKARVIVRGYTNRARVTEAGAGGHGSAEAIRTFTVALTAQSDKAVGGDLWAPGMTAVQTVELDSVTYGDGGTASFSGNESCRVAPDPLMLIAGR
ncbi:MAG: hypothetical protein WBE72_04750 [Terracidiphilus sp.]